MKPGTGEAVWGLVPRFRRTLTQQLQSVEHRTGDPLVVGFSGGLDSMVLLHLLRFQCGDLGAGTLVLVAAHLDHAMRPGSDADALWARGVCAAWGVDFQAGVADPPPEGEADARAVRYGFLHEVARAGGAPWILTAHHGEDQAETVLFRAARGAGIRGLRGIAPVRADGVLRPLLPFFREDLRQYAEDHRITWRDDPTNLDLGPSRNAIRNAVLPGLEAVVPGARRSLARLAAQARREEAAWEGVVPILMERVRAEGLSEPASDRPLGFRFSRDAILTLEPAVRSRLIRGLARRLDRTLSGQGTRAALEFISAGASGRTAPLGSGLSLRRDFGALSLEVVEGDQGLSKTMALEIPEAAGGQAVVAIGGRRASWRWGEGVAPEGFRYAIRFDESFLRFPLTVRGWEPGDRVRLPYGTKKVRKLFAERRVPSRDRTRTPVVVDGSGSVVWIPGLAVAWPGSRTEDGDGGFYLAMREDTDAGGE